MNLNRKYQLYSLFAFLILFHFTLRAQEIVQMTVHPEESFYAHPTSDITIYSDIDISGSFRTSGNSTINFFGLNWNNKAGSSLPDESPDGISGKGGNFKFSRNLSSPQYINQNTSQAGSGFSNISINNSSNVYIEGADLFIRNNLNFESGHLMLNNRNAIIPLNGTITGYNENRFIVTGTGTNGGSLQRATSGLQQANIIFPIGTTADSYTPASVNYAGVAQELKVRVFDNVYDKAVYGTPDNINFVNKTWNISFYNLDPNAKLTFSMQHNMRDESSQFTANRLQSFVSRYATNLEKWDIIPPSGINLGIISSGNAVPNAYVSTRVNISDLSQNEYFSKSVMTETNNISSYKVPSGISPNNDGLNDKFVIQNLKTTDKVRIKIYSRWQSLVFRDTNYNNNFEGIGNQNGLINNILPDGTYYYILNFNDSKLLTGYIIINR